MEHKAVIKIVRLNHLNNHVEYAVKIDKIVVNTLVTFDFVRLQYRFQQNIPLPAEDENNSVKGGDKKSLEIRDLGLKLKYIPDIDNDDDEKYEFNDEVQDEALEYVVQYPVQEDEVVQDEALQDDVQDPVQDKTLSSIIALCYGTKCVIYELLTELTPDRVIISLPLEFFSSKENVFVGRGI